jgi:Spy/CpxP family protein refolding chaperone
MALAADRHGYPGPKHILELKGELALTGEQEKQVRALFDGMRGRALMTGKRLLDKEAELEQLFASGAAEAAAVRARLEEIAALRAELRWVHLSAHLEAHKLLTPEQRARYQALRYGEHRH